MVAAKEMKSLTVAPFECAWSDDLKFKEAGRGCVTFDAFAHNDVTVVFRENIGTQHYHYKKDNSPHYIVIIGSNRNRRLKIQVDGKAVVDEEDSDLSRCSLEFESYWISIYDGLISIGKGRYPFQNLVFQWQDSKPNCNVRYVGLSSWDKHVGYRNVSVFPVTHNHILLWKQVDSREVKGDELGDQEFVEEEMTYDYEQWGLGNFLESWELSDIMFLVGEEEMDVPAFFRLNMERTNGIMVFFFSVTTPLGIVLGMLLQTVYSPTSPTALIVVVVLNACSAGLLNYMALVDLLGADFLGPKLQGNMKLQTLAYVAVFLGAGGMSLMAKWA